MENMSIQDLIKLLKRKMSKSKLGGTKNRAKFGASLLRSLGLEDRVMFHGHWGMDCYAPLHITDISKFVNIANQQYFECPLFTKDGIITHKEFKNFVSNIRKDGNSADEIEKLVFGGTHKWGVEWDNIVTNAGLDYALDVALSGGSQLSTWYVGLVNGASPTFAAGDTMSSHVGWTENQNYDEAARQTWTDGGVSSQSVTNSASTADFTINTDSQTLGGAFLVSDNTKGGTIGTLYAEGDFASDKSADDNDTLSVTATFTSADDGV